MVKSLYVTSQLHTKNIEVQNTIDLKSNQHPE